MTSSCSFRITRTAEDLAQTINALSQRLVKLEQRQEALELHSRNLSQETSAEEIAMLDGVEQILRECKELLDGSDHQQTDAQPWSEEQDNLAA